MGVRSFGAGTQKARQAGADLAQQMGYGAASASVELLTEKMFDGLAGVYGKGFADGVVEGIVDKLAKGRLGPQAVKLISGMSEEAIEELVAGMVDPMLENLYDPQPFFTRYKDPETYAEIGYGMLIGGLMGGIGTGGKLLVNNVTNARANAMVNRVNATDGTNIGAAGVEIAGFVDGARVPGYNRITKMEGAMTDGGAQTRAQLDRASGEGVGDRSGVRLTGEGNASGRALGQGDLSAFGQLRLTEVTDRAAYSQLLDEARGADPVHGWAVTPKTEEDLQNCRIFLTEDGGVGFAIAPDGDIEAVFRNKVRHPQGKAMQSAMPQAIEKGGTKLDCYGAGLVNVYSKVGGFVPVARVAFNPEYANPGWTPDKGMPDIYVMMVTDTDPETVRQKQGSYHYWTDAELDALPLMEYDEAMAYRDRLLAEQHSYGREISRLKEAYKQILAAYGASADIAPEQAGARSEIKLARAILQSQYEAALTQARASGNADLANALYKELLRIQKLERGDDR